MTVLDNPRPTLRLPSKAAEVTKAEGKAELVPSSWAARYFVRLADKARHRLTPFWNLSRLFVPFVAHVPKDKGPSRSPCLLHAERIDFVRRNVLRTRFGKSRHRYLFSPSPTCRQSYHVAWVRPQRGPQRRRYCVGRGFEGWLSLLNFGHESRQDGNSPTPAKLNLGSAIHSSPLRERSLSLWRFQTAVRVGGSEIVKQLHGLRL